MFIAFRLLVFGLFVFLPPHIFLSRVNFPHDPVVTHGQDLFFRHSQKLCRGLLGRFKFNVVQVRPFALRKDIEKYYDFVGSHAKDRPEAAGAAFAFSRDALLEKSSAKGRVGVSPRTRCAASSNCSSVMLYFFAHRPKGLIANVANCHSFLDS